MLTTSPVVFVPQSDERSSTHGRCARKAPDCEQWPRRSGARLPDGRRNIVEIYSTTERLDPYHELTHIIPGEVGAPPALFNEGLAVYMTERLGADALEHLGNPGLTTSTVTRRLIHDGRTIPFDSLMKFDEFGSLSATSVIGYPEAASVVTHLIEQRGPETSRTVPRRSQTASASD